jgi:hypothetical protein
MDHEQARKDALHGPWPSAVEALQGLYGDTWNIYRELTTSGQHGGWVAVRWNPIEGHANKITAADIDRLRESLDAEES